MDNQYHNLRQWVDALRDTGEVLDVKGVHWNHEMGILTQLARRQRQGPALLFDQITDHQEGYRVLVNTLGSTRRLAHTLRLGDVSGYRDLVDKWKAKWKGLVPIPPRLVEKAPVKENTQLGGEVDLSLFPAPFWHDEDGGRYIGTGCVVIMKDPETGWVNLGTYRVQLQGKNEVTVYIGSSHHGSIIRRKYLDEGKPCPIAIVLGQDPVVFLSASSLGIPPNRSEYDFAGGIKGEAITVFAGEMTGLPLPAEAEVILEGHFQPGNRRIEGPFGEFTGYYGSGQREEPCVEVQAVYYRSNPIVLGSPPTRPPNESTVVDAILKSASLEEELKGVGIPGILGAWNHDAGAAQMFVALSINQQYPGHAKQVLVAASNCYSVMHSKLVIVVDEHVDITNLDDLMWAVCTRIEPCVDVEILRRVPSSILDPAVPQGQPAFTSRLLIDATRPYERRDTFAPAITINKEAEKKVLERWGHLLRMNP